MSDQVQSRPAVVFIDDERHVLEGLRRNLSGQRKAWDMHFHADPRQGVSQIPAGTPVLVVTDWSMPGMDGLAVCRTMRDRASREQGGVYVIMLTGRNQVDDLVRALDSGADDYLSKPVDARELEARIRCGLRVLDAETALYLANRELTALAITDQLTGLVNRRQGEHALHLELARLEREQADLSVILTDVDRFKSINDTLGHLAGDAVLREVARRMRSACRCYDTVARWGGEEFLVVCPRSDETAGMKIAERIRTAVASAPIAIDGATSIDVTLSAGVACASPGRPIVVDDLIASCDSRLYRAKQAGRNRVCGDDRQEAA